MIPSNKIDSHDLDPSIFETLNIDGMQHKKINDTKDFTTVLEVVNICDNGGTFFAVVNTNLINASDSPSPGTEFHYLVLSDDQDRKRVIAFEYGGGEKTGFSIMYTRWAFQGQWRQNEWIKITEEFLSTKGGTLTGNLSLNSAEINFVGGDVGGWNYLLRDNSGLTVIRSDNANSCTTTYIKPTVEADTFHFWSDKKYNLYGEHNITKGTTDIGAGSALASGCIHLVYE